MASILQSSIRDTDFLARWGGEEFCVILPETEKPGALALAEKIRKAVENTPFRLQETGQTIPMTISLGVASFIPEGTADGLVKKANRAMLQAKTRGRNRVWDADCKAEKEEAFII